MLRDVRPGFSFASSYSKNSYSLLNFIATNAATYTRFVESDDGNTVRFRMKEIEQWNREVDSLLCQLATLIHLSSGLPSRMSELSGLRYANGNGNKRTVFIYRNRFATLIPNSKAQNEVFRHKGIPRFIPKGRSCQALASFLLYVRPTQLLFANLFKMVGFTAMSVYLFSSWDKADHWTGTYLCFQFKSIDMIALTRDDKKIVELKDSLDEIEVKAYAAETHEVIQAQDANVTASLLQLTEEFKNSLLSGYDEDPVFKTIINVIKDYYNTHKDNIEGQLVVQKMVQSLGIHWTESWNQRVEASCRCLRSISFPIFSRPGPSRTHC